MRPIDVTRNETGATPPIPVDLNKNPFNIGLFLLITGTANATVQYTGDKVQAPGYDASTGNWFPHADLTGATADDHAVLTTPVTAVRLLVNSYTDGDVTLQVRQAGA
jgi:hypothetical protein